MRFKKLRVLLGISLVIFILFVGNVLVFGKLLGEVSPSKNDPVTKDIPVDPVYTQVNETKTTVVKNTTVSPVKNTTVSTPVKKPTPVVVVTKKKTRAS